MRSSHVVRASGCQYQNRNSPGFDPSIFRHRGIWGAADEAVLNNVHKKIPLWKSIVPDLWHFDTDPDPRIRTLDYGSRFFRQWHSNLLKNLVFFAKIFCLLPTVGSTFTSVLKDKKSLRSHKTVEIEVFLNFFACWWKDPDPYKLLPYGSGFWRPKT